MQIMGYCNQKGTMMDTEIPKKTGDMVSGNAEEKENAKKPLMLFGREFSRKQVCAAGAGLVCAALLIGGGSYALAHAGRGVGSNTPAVSQKADDEKQDMALSLEVKAEGWDADTSTPVIAHIEGADGEVDFYTAIAANKKVSLTVGESGVYNVSFIPPVNADGSTYKAASGEVTAVNTDEKTGGIVITLEKVDKDKVTEDDLTAIAKDVAEAVKKGDSTLTGERGVKVVNIFQTNISSNPNADTDAVEKETGKAEETAKEDKSDAKTPETSNGKRDDGKIDSKPSGGSGNPDSGSSSGGSSKKDDTTAHVHKYDIYHPAVTHTETVHHPATTHTEERSICNGCGADITGNEQAHAYNALMAGNKACGAYHTVYNTVTDSAAWDETVTVTDSKAWDETVTVTDSPAYYTCSCGAKK